MTLRTLICCLLMVLGLTACEETRATPEQCRVIFDRLVVLELQEMGFNDPLLAQRRQQELFRKYASEIDKCVGRTIPENAMTCIKTAKTAEVVSHQCLH